ncbi:MAG: acetylornithine deacetylase [Arenicellales bacterium]|nr:acetylornithine deacetylase [Arenicellales bacterium]
MNNEAPSPRAETMELLKTLVSFDTTSYRSNLELIDYVREYLNHLGVTSTLDFNKDKTKANLYAVIGPQDRGGIALSGHTDVVPVEGQNWTVDPWQLTQKDNLIYGRGSADMKGFISVVLAAVPNMMSVTLNKPIHLCLSYDEEIGCLGVRSLLEYLSTQDNRPQACFVGEPTNMDVVIGHKGKLATRCRVKGHACHSSLAPQGVNAVEFAAKIITYLSGMAKRKQQDGPFDEAYDVPHTTVHTGVIHGGTMVNVVPEECEFIFEFRNLPTDDPENMLIEVQKFARDKLEPAMKEVDPETGFLWEEESRFPGLDTAVDAEVAKLAQRFSGSRSARKVAFGTEAGGFARTGIPAVVCGPGSIQQAHKPDEFIHPAQLIACERFVDEVIHHLSN